MAMVVGVFIAAIASFSLVVIQTCIQAKQCCFESAFFAGSAAKQGFAQFSTLAVGLKAKLATCLVWFGRQFGSPSNGWRVSAASC